MQSFQHKKHLFFDLDHTLWDFDKNSGFAFDTIFKQQGFEIELSDFLNIYIPRNQHYWKLYQVNQISHDDLRYYRLKDVFDALHFEVSDEMIAWKTKGTAIYQELAREGHIAIQPCEPYIEFVEQTPTKIVDYSVWTK